MNVLLFAAGALLLGLATVDIIWSVFSMNGGGPLTRPFASLVGRAVRRFTASGAMVLVTIPALWFVMLWLAWTLIFLAGSGSVVETMSGNPAGLADHVYFTGFTLFTLGVGDFRPQGGFWQILTAFASLNGFVYVTLSIAFLIPVVSAVVEKRRIAVLISALGVTAEDIVINSWAGKDWRGLERQLTSLAPLVALHAERHLAYPVLQYYHSPVRRESLETSAAALFEALLMLEWGLRDGQRPEPVTMRVMRAALAQYLDTVAGEYIGYAGTTPPAPDLSALRSANLPTVDADAFLPMVATQEFRRRQFLALVHATNRTWSEVSLAGQGETA
jgi:hypothetical protein